MARGFEGFRHYPRERILTNAGRPVRLGGKAFDILTVLLDHAGALVPAEMLIAGVWRDINVADGALRVHVASLRKALGKRADGSPYIVNVAGKGYCFTASVRPLLADAAPAPTARSLDTQPTGSSTLRASAAENPAMIGREGLAERLSEQLAARRLLTIVGPGGVGKTTLAGATAASLHGRFDRIGTVDLTSARGADAIPAAIIEALGLRSQAGAPLSALSDYLRDHRTLLVLDGCEHLIETAALVVETLLGMAPGLHILATSREPLRILEERIVRLGPLACPPVTEQDPAAIAAYPAVQLFMARVSGRAEPFDVDAADAGIIAHLCRALDGLPLAIELAAGQYDLLGLDGLALGLKDLFGLLTLGRRTSAPRHQTLRATLDWSFRLLSDAERKVLPRLGVFSGGFTLDSASEVAICPALDREAVRDAIANLASKSMIAVVPGQDAIRFHLLDTTRAYARRKLEEAGEAAEVSHRHVTHILSLLKGRADFSWRDSGVVQGSNKDLVADIRAGLRWVFSAEGDHSLRIPLTLAAATVFAEMSLLSETRIWLEKAIGNMSDAERKGLWELRLRVAYLATSPTAGAAEENLAAVLELAEEVEDKAQVIFTLEIVFLLRLRTADYQGALDVAERIGVLLPSIKSLSGRFAADWMRGVPLHFLGDHVGAQEAFLRGLAHSSASPDVVRFSGHPKLYAHVFGARCLWMRGDLVPAYGQVRAAAGALEHVQNPMMRAVAQVWLAHLLFWAEDLEGAAILVGRLDDGARRHGLNPQAAMAALFAGKLAILRGDILSGIETVAFALRQLDGFEQKMMVPAGEQAMAEGLVRLGRHEEALAANGRALCAVADTRARMFAPELLLQRAEILEKAGKAAFDVVMQAYEDALAQAREQTSPIWIARILRAWHAYLATCPARGERLGDLADEIERIGTVDMPAMGTLFTDPDSLTG